MALFDRVASLTVGQSGKEGILIEDLRFSFKIEKRLTETLNNSTLSIYNLNPDSRKLVQTPNNAVILKAGYRNDAGAVTCFVGIVRRCLTVRDGVDWRTDFELDDGLIAYRDSKHSMSFAPGRKGIDVMIAVANKFNLPIRALPENISNKTYPQGWAFVGRTREAMTSVCQYLGLEWSIQNQEIQILKKGGSLKRTAIVLSSDTGMIGSPALEAKTMSEKAAAKIGISATSAGVIKRRKEDAKGEVDDMLEIQGYKITSLLQPTIEPGHVIKLEAEGVDGFFKVEKIEHIADTHGADWKSVLSVRFI
jgi:hypothetical protein